MHTSQQMSTICAVTNGISAPVCCQRLNKVVSNERRYMYCDLHYNGVVMSTMASQITSLTSVYLTVYPRCRSKKTWKLRVTGLCVGNSPVTGEFPHKWPVGGKMCPFDDVIMKNKLFPACSAPSRQLHYFNFHHLLYEIYINREFGLTSQWPFPRRVDLGQTMPEFHDPAISCPNRES